MANLVITKACNLNCSYCFAQNYMNSPGETNITIEQLNNILNYFSLAPDKVHHISLIGGEPLLHPQFSEIYDIVTTFIEDNSIGEYISIFTNGINLIDYKDIIENAYIIVNVNKPTVVGIDNYNKMKQGIIELQEYNQIILGINLYQNMEDYNYIFTLAKELNIDEIRCSYIVPSNQNELQNKFNYYDQGKELFLNFCNTAINNEIQLNIDCNHIPKCRFTEEELNIVTEACGVSMDWCYPAIDIMPDMTVSSCFGFMNPVNLNDFKDLEEIENYFMNNFTTPKIESRTNCANNCPLEIYGTTWDHDKCQGGCLGFND